VAGDHNDEANKPEEAENLEGSNTADFVAEEEGEQGSGDGANLDHAGDVGLDLCLVVLGAVF
jgi:hypothetical protein